MMRKLCLCLVAAGALSAAPAAAGDGPMYVTQSGNGVASTMFGGPVRLVPIALSNTNDTALEAISTKDSSVVNMVELVGQWGLPYTPAGAEGISHNGRTLVLADTQSGRVTPSLFLVLDPRKLQIRYPITLKGYFSYDAMSPDGRRLYLIQYTQGKYGDISHYIVRAYDLRTEKLLPGRIADRTQKSWVMNGYPMSRTTSPDGRWVYTLYQNPGNGYPFIHALDTVRGVAHCVGLPIQNQSGIYNIVLSLHGRTLAVHWRSGRPYFNVDTTTWRVTPAHGAGFPWPWTAIALVPLAGIGALLLRRRRRTEELEQELAELLRVPEREVVV
jgi:MYXO-CTERM domain-containing protein